MVSLMGVDEDVKYDINAIQRANVDDAETILALQQRAYASEARLYNDWSIPPLTQTLDSQREDLATTCVLKYVRDGMIVGSVRGHVENGACQIGRLIVEPTLQGQGIGTALLQAIEEAFPQVTRFALFTGSRSEGNIRLYRRCGFEITERKIVSPTLTLVFMVKPAKKLQP